MAQVLVPFLMSMLLGRTIDLTTYFIGGGIYDNAVYDESDFRTVNTTYTVLQSNAFPYASMGLPVDIVLRIKSGLLSSSSGGMGLDGLLKETAWKQSSAVVAVASSVLTVKRTLQKSAKLLPDWRTRIPEAQTHFANSIFYGGWIYILYSFKCNIPGDVQIVRNTLTSLMGIHGRLQAETIELWKKAVETIQKNPEIRGKVTLNAHTYSSFPFEQNVKSLDNLLSAISTIPDVVGHVGKPFYMELLPLHDLDERFPAVQENHDLDKKLEQIDEMLDDAKYTKDSLTHWVIETSKEFTDSEVEKISSLLNHVSTCLKLFYKVASEASIYKHMNPEFLDSAIYLYRQKLERHPDTYHVMYRRLREDIDAQCEDSFLHKIKGLLEVEDSKKLFLGKVDGGLEDCKRKCLDIPECRSVGYVEKMLTFKRDTNSETSATRLIIETKQCYVYFRSSSTATVLEEPESISRYETTDSSEDVRNLLEVSADVALKIKTGNLDLKGTGSYLRDTAKLGRVIEILTRLKFKTVSVALPPEVKPLEGWTLKNKNDLGTHFVRSVTYGGELLASIRFKANKEEDFKSINAAITGNFTGGDATSLVAEGKLESLQSSLKDKASMEISYYATVPLKGVPNTIDGLRSLVRDFDKHVKEVNNGWGVPIRVELMELSSLGGVDSSQFQFLKNRALEAELTDLEHEFDDLRKANTMLTEWYRGLPTSITKEQEEEVNKLFKRIRNILRPYYDSIGKLNIEEGPEKQLKTAREAYREGKMFALPGKFTKEFNRLVKRITVVEKKMYGTGTGVYVHWGTKQCPESPMMFQLNSGYISTTTNRGTGGGSDYLCLPENPEKEDSQPSFGHDTSAILSGAKYGMMDENPFSDNDVRYYFSKGIPCSTCHLTNRTLIHVFPAQSECPEDWIHEYSGFLMAGSNLPGTHICMDENPEAFENISEEQQMHTMSVVRVSDKDGGLKKPPYIKNAAIKCIVCSK